MKKFITFIAIIIVSFSANAQQRFLDEIYRQNHTEEEKALLLITRNKGESRSEYKARRAYEKARIKHQFHHDNPIEHKDECQFCQSVYIETVETAESEAKKIANYASKISREKERIEFLKKEISNIENKFIDDYNSKNQKIKDSLSVAIEKQIKVAEKDFASKFSAKTISNATNVIDDIKYYLSGPNSAGGCDFHFTAKNRSEKVIKYLHISVSFKNAVDDYVYDDIRDTKTMYAKDTGPYEKWNTIGGVWECLIYNYSAHTPVIHNIRIEYMDKTSVTLTLDDIKNIQKYSETKPRYSLNKEVYNAFAKMGRTESQPEIKQKAEARTKDLRHELEILTSDVYNLENEKREHEIILQNIQKESPYVVMSF